METGKKADLIRIIDSSTKDLHNRVDMQRHILATVIDKKIKKADICPDCLFSECPYKKKLKRVLTESIAVLEGTKRSFKSKKLELLRKDFIRLLAETD
ncbi:MAG: hypothetical protein ACNY01_12575 [Desulfobacteria bacterium]|jgi:glutaredoxin|nr:hypothetical protein [Deltaproteobacteria bacterium]OEU53155.1 MAG: hypothetical protein BA868_02170 [Desulfobacterales bacterium C00003106]